MSSAPDKPDEPPSTFKVSVVALPMESLAAATPAHPHAHGHAPLSHGKHYELLDNPAFLLDPTGTDLNQLVEQPTRQADLTRRVMVDRKALTHQQFEELNEGESVVLTAKERISKWCKSVKCDRKSVSRRLLSYVPVVNAIKTYRFKQWIAIDIVAGLTVGVFNVPQSLGHTLLINLPLVYGLYASFLPILLYCIFGASPHAQFGTISITCLLVGNIVAARTSELVPANILALSTSKNGTIAGLNMTKAQAINYVTEAQVEIAMAVAFMMGIYQIATGLLKITRFTIYFADPMVAGYTTASVLYIFSQQVKYIFGVSFARPVGNFNLFMNYILLFQNITKTNVATLIVSIISIVVLCVFKFVINPRTFKKIHVPLPTELIVLILGVVISYYMQLHTVYGVAVMGAVQNGLPAPAVPNMQTVALVAGDSVVPTLVTYGVAVSLVQVLAKKHGYEVDDSQEAIAYGMSNFISSFFVCYPTGVSTSRTCVAQSLACKSQLVGFLTSIITLIVVYAAVSLLAELPVCILSAVIMVGVTSMVDQFKSFGMLCKVAKFDALIWAIAFFPTVFLDLPIGLLIGIAGSLLIVIVRSQFSRKMILGNVPNTEIYENVKRYPSLVEYPDVKIFRFAGPINFPCAMIFRQGIYKKTGVNPRHVIVERKKRASKTARYEEKLKKTVDPDKVAKYNEYLNSAEPVIEVKCVIIELSNCSYIDYSGLRTVKQVIREYSDIGIEVFLAGCSRSVFATLSRTDFYQSNDISIVFNTIQDAVIMAKYRISAKDKDVSMEQMNQLGELDVIKRANTEQTILEDSSDSTPSAEAKHDNINHN